MSNIKPILKRLQARVDELDKKVCALLDSGKSLGTIEKTSESSLTQIVEPVNEVAQSFAFKAKTFPGAVDGKPIRKKRTFSGGN